MLRLSLGEFGLFYLDLGNLWTCGCDILEKSLPSLGEVLENKTTKDKSPCDRFWG
jgi:hypothetical protein